MRVSCLVALCVPCMTCDVLYVIKAVGTRGSFKRHEAHRGIGSFTQNIPKLDIERVKGQRRATWQVCGHGVCH